MRVLLHACCGPCAIEPLEALRVEHDVTLLFSNPNIHPSREYRRRRDVLADYSRAEGIELIEHEYDPNVWLQAVSGHSEDAAARCAACYALRLSKTASTAAESGFDAIATTMTVSPYQDADAIRLAGERSAVAVDLPYLHTDFRSRYRAGVERAKALGMYRQRYCGCFLSETEADAARARKEQVGGPGGVG